MNGYEELRRLMFEHNMTQADVIRGTGITRPTLCNWRSGKHQPTLTTLKKIADFFGVSVSVFLVD